MKIIPTKNRNKEAPSDDSTAIQRKKWVRKAPLISSAVGPNDATVDPRSMKTKHVINSDNKNGRTMGEIREQLLNFLNSIHLEEWYRLFKTARIHFKLGARTSVSDAFMFLGTTLAVFDGRASFGFLVQTFSKPNVHCIG